MHTFAKKSFEFFKKTYLSKFNNPKIVDVGSLDINGSIRDQVNFKSEYIGVDLTEGKNVDKVLENPYKLPFDDNSIDIIVSISVFEHVEFFWETFLEMLRVLKPNGLLFINAPANGHYHRHDSDNWRFYPDAGESLSKWGKQKGYNCVLLESFIHDYTGRERNNDFVAVFLKDKKNQDIYKDRIIDNYKNFRNGKTNRNDEIINLKLYMQDQDNYGWKLFYKINKFLTKFKIK
jgi:SAM-dependent methyltransferase